MRKDYHQVVAKPAIIDTPILTLDEVASIYGISPTRRDQIARSVERLVLKQRAVVRRPASRRTSRQAAVRKSRKK